MTLGWSPPLSGPTFPKEGAREGAGQDPQLRSRAALVGQRRTEQGHPLLPPTAQEEGGSWEAACGRDSHWPAASVEGSSVNYLPQLVPSIDKNLTLPHLSKPRDRAPSRHISSTFISGVTTPHHREGMQTDYYYRELDRVLCMLFSRSEGKSRKELVI